jgi:hypothetical protein
MRIGQSAAYATIQRRIGTPKPKKKTASGITETAGIGRRNSISRCEASRRVRELPMRTPTVTPSTTAIARPWT